MITEQSEAPLPREAYTLLAQANLLRMRGCWEEAVEKCMAALRLAPESASAQSLLGDIYENQGRRDDAIQWYRMALDISPDSPADRLKLGPMPGTT
jgi:Flp pilus assembly protein TadD